MNFPIKITKIVAAVIFITALTVALIITYHNRNNNTRIVALEIKQQMQNSSIHSLKERISDLELNNLITELSSWARFNPSSKEFQAVKTDMGIFYIKLENIEKYADGYKVIFAIGNPNNTTYGNTKVTISYGENENRKTHETTALTDLLPSYWNDIDVILSPAAENDISNIFIKIEPTTVKLKPGFRH